MEKVYPIDEAVLKNAPLCQRSFKCLFSSKGLCPVEDVIDNRVFFVKNTDNTNCQNYIPYGLTGCCKCAVRKELHRKYNI